MRLEQRSKEQGVYVRASSGRKDERVLLYSLDSRRENKDSRRDNREIVTVHPDLLESGEERLVESTFRRYNKVVSHLFAVYA